MTTGATATSGGTAFRHEEPLTDPRHEAFAQAVARGGLLGQSYKGAGFDVASSAAGRANACRLKRRPEVAARILHLRASAAMDAGGPVDKGTKIAILSRLILDTGLSASERLAAIAAHSRYVGDAESDRSAPSPETVAQWLADDEEVRTPEHLAKVLACLARLYRVTPERLVEVAAASTGPDAGDYAASSG
jgi:hypothetical protein